MLTTHTQITHKCTQINTLLIKHMYLELFNKIYTFFGNGGPASKEEFNPTSTYWKLIFGLNII